jgi:hypothetical protein
MLYEDIAQESRLLLEPFITVTPGSPASPNVPAPQLCHHLDRRHLPAR